VRLPTLGQDGTLVLRSGTDSPVRVRIVPRWRDDSLLEMLPMISTDEEDHEDDGENVVEGEPEFVTFGEASTSTTQSFGRMRLRCRADGVETSLGRRGALVEVDVAPPTETRCGPEPTAIIVATVPEKCNVTCRVANGDIEVVGKLEGDARLSTSRGNITVSKLRGHYVTLDATPGAAGDLTTTTTTTTTTAATAAAAAGMIHVRKAVEARSIKIGASSRVRARMLNGSDVSIRVSPSKEEERAATRRRFDRLDDDDEGALIDVGSLYVSDGGGGVDGFRNATEALNVTAELVRRGYTEQEIAKIWGGNLLRVMERVEKVAGR